jgi:HK97 family phage major capsid protein
LLSGNQNQTKEPKMKIQELQEKRASIMTQAQAIAIADNQTAETRAKFDAMLAEADALEGDINRIQAVERFEAEHRTRTTPPRPGVETASTDPELRAKNEKKAFEQYFRGGISNVSPELRSSLKMETRELESSGGAAAFIPQGYLDSFFEALKFYGPMQDLVTTKVTDNNGAPVKYATLNDTGSVASVLTEGSTIAETDPSFQSLTLNTDMITSGLVQISWQELADSHFDLQSILNTEFAKRFGRFYEGAITNGDSSNITGLTATFTTGVSSASPTAVAYGDLANLFATLDPAYIRNATWIMNASTRGKLLGIVDGNGRPLLQSSVAGAGTETAFSSLFGYPVVLNQSLPNVPSTAGSVTPIMFGDFKNGYVFRIDGAPKVVVLKERYADILANGFFAYQRAGGATVVPNSSIKPVQSLVMAG